MRVSRHAKKRLKERCGLKKKSKDRIAERVFDEGITHAQTKGKLNRWITKLYFHNEMANNIRIFGGNAYIFAGETLVTVIPVPNNIRKNMKKMIENEEDLSNE